MSAAKREVLDEFKIAVASGNPARAHSMLRHNPQLARFHEKDEDGRFVTALDIAMNVGWAVLCEDLLNAGARMDLPIGAPPDANNIGQTSMIKVLSKKYAQEVPNHRQMIQILVNHHKVLETQRKSEPILSALQEKANAIFEKMSTNVRNVMASDKALLSSFTAPVSAAGMAGSLALQKAMSQPTLLLAIAGSVVAGGAVYAAHRQAQNSMEGNRLRLRQDQAVDVFDRAIGMPPRKRTQPLTPLTDNVLANLEPVHIPMEEPQEILMAPGQ